MELDKLLLMSGNDIPFAPAKVSIHQPTLKEIGYIGEATFHMGCHFLTFDKNKLDIKDKNDLESQSDFDIFMSVVNNPQMIKHKIDVMMLLTLLFPNYKVNIEKDKILLQLENFSSNINKVNYSDFKDILNQIFCLNAESGGDGFNPEDKIAQRIAEKIAKGKQKRDKQKGEDNKTIYDKYISILSVGLKKDKNELLNYTVYQIIDEFKRFRLKEDFDLYVKAKLAGAQDLEEVKNWME